MDTARSHQPFRSSGHATPPRAGAPWLAPSLVLAALALPLAATAQPFDVGLGLSGPTHGYVRVPNSSALNPTSGFTLEAWVRVQDPGGGCSSIAGKNFQTAWWVGICGTTLRSYLRGSSSVRDGGDLPPTRWSHLAVTFDGAARRHYVDGELVATFVESGPLSASTDELRIGSDVQWQFTPNGTLDEVRLWNVARTRAQLRAAINTRMTTAAPGLVAIWPFEGSFADIIGSHAGTAQGAGLTFRTFPVGLPCPTHPTFLCIGGSGERFLVTASFRTGPPGTAEGLGRVATSNAGSGIFWFFSPDNWEVLVKSIDACGFNNRHWIYTAATTDQFYRLTVFDLKAGKQKIYFNYPGPPAPAVTDSNAFATCP